MECSSVAMTEGSNVLANLGRNFFKTLQAKGSSIVGLNGWSDIARARQFPAHAYYEINCITVHIQYNVIKVGQAIWCDFKIF